MMLQLVEARPKTKRIVGVLIDPQPQGFLEFMRRIFKNPFTSPSISHYAIIPAEIFF